MALRLQRIYMRAGAVFEVCRPGPSRDHRCVDFRVSVSCRRVSRKNSKPSPTRTEGDTTSRNLSEIVDGSPPALDDRQFYLALVEGARAGEWVMVGDAPVTLGRDRHLDIVLSGTDVSRLHLLASVLDGSVVIEDLGSTNGTFIDGRRIT